MPQDTGIASRLRSRTRASEPNIIPSEPDVACSADHERENIPVSSSLKRKRGRAEKTKNTPKDVVKSGPRISNEASALQDRTNEMVVVAASGSGIAEAVALVAIANQKSSLRSLNDKISISTSSPSPFKNTSPYYTGPDRIRPPSPDPPSPQNPTQSVPCDHIVNTGLSALDTDNPTTPTVVADESNHVSAGAAPEPGSVFVDSLDEFFPPTSDSTSSPKSVRCRWDGCQETIEVFDVEDMVQHLAVGHLFELFPPATRSSGEDEFPFPSLFVECAWECDERDGGKDEGCCEIEIVVMEQGDIQAIARHVWDHHGMIGKSTLKVNGK